MNGGNSSPNIRIRKPISDITYTHFLNGFCTLFWIIKRFLYLKMLTTTTDSKKSFCRLLFDPGNCENLLQNSTENYYPYV